VDTVLVDVGSIRVWTRKLPFEEARVRTAVPMPILFMILVSQSAPANAQATLEKCACHVDPNAAESTSGSRAVNATLCVQQMDPNRHWCEVTIECLRGGIGPDCSTMPKDTQGITRLFFQHIDALSSDPSIVAKEMIDKSKDTAGILAYTLKDEAETYNSCFDALRKNTTISLEGKGKYGFKCAVNKEGWATLRFEAPPYTISYFFAEQPK
jgi:hypothetical protein